MNNELKFYIDKTYHDSLSDDFEKYLSSDVGMLLSYVGESIMVNTNIKSMANHISQK